MEYQNKPDGLGRNNTESNPTHQPTASPWVRRNTADPLKGPVNQPAGDKGANPDTNPRATIRPGTSAPLSQAPRKPVAENGGDGNKGMNEPPRTNSQRQTDRKLIWIIAALLVVIVGLAAWFFITTSNQNKQIEQALALKEAAELDASQRDLQNAYDELSSEFAQFENQRKLVLDDSVKRELSQRYEAARLQVEKLQQELRNQKNMSAQEIQKLKNEIETLRNLLRHYVEEINRLNLENQNLRNENAEIKDRNEQLTSRVQETSRRNEELSERMTLAEKLNVTGVNLVALNKKGKQEKKVSKARQLRVTFTIPQNNSTPVGAKTIYLRITSPSGQVLPGGGSFTFEGSTLECTAKTVIEYAGEELGGVTIFWDVNTALTPGQYTVELFADNFRLTSRSFELN